MSDDPNRNLGPPQIVRGATLEEEEKALKKGNTWVLVAACVAALAIGAGIIVLLAQEDPTVQYRTIGQRVNGMKTQHFDGFWACALPNERLDNLGSDQDLRRAINERARTRPAAYAQHVRQRCLVKLTEHQPKLTELIPPADLIEPLAALTTALGDLKAAWDAYNEHLDHVETYDEAAAGSLLTAIARGWYDYKRAHGTINNIVREHLGSE